MLKIWPHGLMSLHKLSPHAEKYLKNISTLHTFLTTAYITTPHIRSEKHVKMHLYIPNYFKHHLKNPWELIFQHWLYLSVGKKGNIITTDFWEFWNWESTNSSKNIRKMARDSKWKDILRSSRDCKTRFQLSKNMLAQLWRKATKSSQVALLQYNQIFK